MQAWDFEKARRHGVIRNPIWSCNEVMSHRCAIVYMIFVPGLDTYPEDIPDQKPIELDLTQEDFDEEREAAKKAVSSKWKKNADGSDDEDEGVTEKKGDEDEDAGAGTGLTSPLSPNKSKRREKTVYAGSRAATRAKLYHDANKELMESLLSKDELPAEVEDPAGKGELITFSEDNIMTSWDVETHERLWTRHFPCRLIGHELIDRRQLWLTFADTTLLIIDAFTGACCCVLAVQCDAVVTAVCPHVLLSVYRRNRAVDGGTPRAVLAVGGPH